MNYRTTFLNEDYCAIEDKDFFVRGLIELPILGTAEVFCWGAGANWVAKVFTSSLKRRMIRSARSCRQCFLGWAIELKKRVSWHSQPENVCASRQTWPRANVRARADRPPTFAGISPWYGSSANQGDPDGPGPSLRI